MKRYVIVGNGTAAVGCIEGIRSADPTGSITVVSSENEPAYCRPLISYYLEDKTDEQRMLYRAPDFYEKNGCEVLYGLRGERLDAVAKTLTLSDGQVLDYDAVCLATGSAPFVPPMKGLEQVEDRFSFMTIADARALKAKASADTRVLIIGAGLIGLKCAEGLHGFVGSITVCDLADRVLSSILDADGASLVQKHLEEAGISFLLADSVAEFTGNTALMKSGTSVDFDLLVTAVGVRPNTAILKDAGGAVGRGMTVDAGMHTSLPDVYAAGDCTESVDITDGNVKIMALMPNAYMQGYTAGANMAGTEHLFDNAIPMNSIGFFGYHVMTAGTRGDELYCAAEGDTLKKLYVRDNKLVGFEIVGEVKNTGIYTGLIRNQTDLGEINPENMKKTPDMTIFSAQTRKKVLGGVV